MDSTKNIGVSATNLHKDITNNENVRREWIDGNVPKFPFYHGINTLGKIIQYHVYRLCLHNNKEL